MSWKAFMDECGGGEIAYLSEDGECITFIVVADPALIAGKFRGTTTERVGCPVISQEGFTLLVLGKRLARRISKHEARFADSAFTIVRHGEHDDIRTKYELTICPDEALTKELFNYKETEFEESQIDEAIKYAEEVANA